MTIGELAPPMRLMMTPGPSSIDPASTAPSPLPVVGHLDPFFKTCMSETQELMRQIFQTTNRITMPMSATGSGGIETAIVNTLEAGDEAIVCVNGYFSERMFEVASRTQAKITKVEAPLGRPVDPTTFAAPPPARNQNCGPRARRNLHRRRHQS